MKASGGKANPQAVNELLKTQARRLTRDGRGAATARDNAVQNRYAANASARCRSARVARVRSGRALERITSAPIRSIRDRIRRPRARLQAS